MKVSRYAYLLLALVPALALAGCFDGNKDAENKKKIEAQLARLPGSHNATVVVKGDTLTITGFKADIPYAGMGVNRITLEELSAEGVDFDAAAKAGVVPVAKKVSFKNYTSSMEFSSGAGLGGSGSATSVVGLMSLTGLQIDAGAFDKALGTPAAGDKAEKPVALPDLIAALMTFKAESSVFQNYRVDMNLGIVSITMSMDKGTSGAMTMLSWKDMSLENFKATAFGSEVFSLGKWTIKNFSVPDIVTPAMKQVYGSADPKADPFAASAAYEHDLAEAFKKSPIIVQGMVMEDMKVRPMTNEPLTLKKVSLDIEFSQNKLILKKDVEGFVIPPSVYGKGLEGRALAKLYGKPFELSGAVDFEAVKDGEGGRIAVNSLRLADKNLGGLDFSLKGAFPQGNKEVPAVPESGDDVRLNKLDLTLKDAGALDLIFGLLAEEEKGYNPSATKESTRAEIIGSLTPKEGDGAAKRQIIDAFSKFLSGSGTFSLSMAPSFPVTFDELEKVMDSAAEGLNISVKTIPPTK